MAAATLASPARASDGDTGDNNGSIKRLLSGGTPAGRVAKRQRARRRSLVAAASRSQASDGDDWEPGASSQGSSDGEHSDSSWDTATSSTGSEGAVATPEPARRGAKGGERVQPRRPSAVGKRKGKGKPLMSGCQSLPLAGHDHVLPHVLRCVEDAATMAPLGVDPVVVRLRRSALRDGQHNVLLLLVMERLHVCGCFEPGASCG